VTIQCKVALFCARGTYAGSSVLCLVVMNCVALLSGEGLALRHYSVRAGCHGFTLLHRDLQDLVINEL
jgi:hypothetical protein